ncbi:MAG: response regulator [Myxococcales bacterium]|nr:response regulator [Myxococcales bacterium]
MLTPPRLTQLLDTQRTTGLRLCSQALTDGIAEERVLVRALSGQLGVPGAVVAELTADVGGAAVVPEAVARRLCVLPARLFHRTLTLLMRDPTDQAALDEVALCSGKVIRPLVALESPLRDAIDHFYGMAGEIPNPTPASGLVVATAPTDAGGPEVHPINEAPLAPEGLDMLPANHASPPTPEAMPALADPRPVILAVDDEPSILKLYEVLLSAYNYRLVTGARGDEALDLVRTHRPRLVLLDALLPGMHGFEICRRIKENQAFAGTRIILLSAAYRGWQYRTDLIEQYGADDFIEKPFDVNNLIDTIERLIGETPPAETGARALRTVFHAALDAGVDALRIGDLAAAADHLHHASEADPFAARPHFYLGKIHEHEGNLFEAMYEFEQAVALDATWFPAIKDLAILYQNQGFRQKAIETWQQALAASPDEPAREAIREHLIRLFE